MTALSASQLRATGARRLAEAGIDSAGADSAWLLSHVLGVEPGRLLLVDEVSDDDQAAFATLVERRATRTPLQHLTEQAYFAGVELAVGPGVFIPRPETELLVEWATAQARELSAHERPLRIVDLCSGSGALALAIATAVPSAQVIAVERSPHALAYLRRNVVAQPAAVAERVRVIAGDVADPAVLEACGPQDLIVSNPPYVPASAPVSPEVAHDPADAVFSGESGMDLIDTMVPLIASALVPGGAVAVEHDDTTAAATAVVFERTGLFSQVRSHDDLTGRPRYVTARRNAGPDVQGWKP